MQQIHSYFADRFDAVESGSRIDLLHVNGPAPTPPTPLPVPPAAPAPTGSTPAPAPAAKPDKAHGEHVPLTPPAPHGDAAPNQAHAGVKDLDAMNRPRTHKAEPPAPAAQHVASSGSTERSIQSDDEPVASTQPEKVELDPELLR